MPTTNDIDFVTEQVESLRTKWDSELFATIQKSITELMGDCTEKIERMKSVEENIKRCSDSNTAFDEFVAAASNATNLETRYELYMAYMALVGKSAANAASESGVTDAML